MPTIPLVDLQAQYRSIKTEIDAAIQGVLDRGQFILGPEVEALEQEVAVACGTRYAVAVASGTDALELSLRACGITTGDEVITTAYSFFATAEAIVAVGATPVFVDIDPLTYNLDLRRLESHITPKTRALLPVHLYGHPCAMDQVMAIAKQHHLRVVEDCAQAIGARYRAQAVGAFGDAGALSFFPSKNLGGYGDGGMVVTSDPAIADQIRLLRTHGSQGKYWHVALGTNSRLDELQAAILRVKLRHLDRWNATRRHHATRYTEQLAKLSLPELVVPTVVPHAEHVYHQYTVRVTQRDQLKESLTQAGISAQVYYPSILPAQPALAPCVSRSRSYPEAEQACHQVLSLPMFPELSGETIDQIVRQIARALHPSRLPA